MATTKQDIVESLKKGIASFRAASSEERVGEVVEIADGIVRILGLGTVKAGEMLLFPKNTYGVALNLEDGVVGAMILGDYGHIKEGDEVKNADKLLSIGVGDSLLGRVVNPLGEPIDGKGILKNTKSYLIERAAPGVIDREPVGVSLSTGIKAIDAMVPIGQGQRQLIIGDRQSGKTAIAIDTILNQKGKGVKCIYVAIGQKESKVARLVARLTEAGAMEYTTVVVAGASDNASLSYIAPYAGCAIGEYFMDKGEHALVIYDDLSKHAWAYRQIALLLRRPPGREAYPGDIFYLHSRLLERAARMSKEKGGGSLTALPIIETQAGDVSAYIPTNVISITDGQIYLDTDLFYRGIRPAINVGLSVSRVGGAAQIKAMKKVAGRLRLDLAQFRELEAFSQFASELDQKTREQIERGRRLVELLKQPQYSPLDVAEQVFVIYGGANGYLDDVSVDAVREWEGKFLQYLGTARKDALDKVRSVGELNKDIEALIKEVIQEFKKR